jgi:hypothetical protein
MDLNNIMIVFIIPYGMSCNCVHVQVVEICGSSSLGSNKGFVVGVQPQVLGMGAKRVRLKIALVAEMKTSTL